MDYQPDVGLVYAHAKGIGGRDDAQVATDESLLDALLGFRRKSRMEVLGLDILLAQEACYLLGSFPGCTVDDRAIFALRGELGREHPGNMIELGLGRGGYDRELKIVAIGTAVEQPEADAHFLAKVLEDVIHDIRLRRRGQAEHGGYRALAGPLLDEAAHIAIVRAEIMTPFGQAVRLVQDPGANFTLRQRFAKGAVAQLFGRDNQDADIAQSNPVQDVRPLWHGKQAVYSGAAGDAFCFQAGNLVGHQRNQRGNDYRQRARLFKARERRDLVADRLAGASRQDPEHMLAAHRRLHDALLQGPAILVHRLRAKAGKRRKPANQLLDRVVALLAPRACGILARRVPEQLDQPPRLRKLVAYPGRHHGIPARHGEPRNRIGERPAIPLRIRQDMAAMRTARITSQQGLDCRRGLLACWPELAAHGDEEGIQSGIRSVDRRQPVPGGEIVRIRGIERLQGPVLITKHLQR